MILAIIALIATPLILGVIDSAKIGAAENSAIGFVKSVEQYYVKGQMEGNSSFPKTVNELNNVIDIKGEKPSQGNIKFDNDNQVSEAELCINGYYVKYDGKKAKADKSKTCDDIVIAPIKECTFDGELFQGVDYVNGDYTYRYMQEYGGSSWYNMDHDGWGVIRTGAYLVGPQSTEAKVNPVCTHINGKPVVSMSHMFTGLDLSNIDFSGFNTSEVINMRGMFSKTTGKINLDLSSFDTSKVTNMIAMFQNSEATSINLSSFDTRNVESMGSMFSHSGATSLDLSSFNTENVTIMSYMFCESQATSINLSSFDIRSVSSLDSMFEGSKVKSLDLSNFDTTYTFSMDSMFAYSEITTLDLSSFNMENVYSGSGMFTDCQATVGYARTQADADKFNATSNKPAGLNFIVK